MTYARLLQVLTLGASIMLALPGVSISLPADTKPLLPLDGLGKYSTYRDSLIRAGWRPVAQSGGEAENPEASCGNAFCTAHWRDSSGFDALIVLWDTYVDDKRVLLLAPSPYEINAAAPHD